MQGKLIVFEGVEGGGKTTQMQRIQGWLQGLIDTPVIITREPGGTLLGQELRRLLLEYQGEETHRKSGGIINVCRRPRPTR